jgi:predicted ATPase
LLYQQIKKGELGGREKVVEVEPSADSMARLPLADLPELLTPFIGRAEELARLENYFQEPTCRLVTITGLGGTGKSWLALQAARAAHPAFTDGVYFVPLVGLAGSDLAGQTDIEEIQQQLLRTMSKAVGLELSGQDSLFKQLGDYLRSKQLLLVLDNFEHLLDGAGLLIGLLQHAPALKLLVTSREPLNLLGEWILTLEGLDYPAVPAPEPDWGQPEPPSPEERWRTPAGVEQLATFSAVQLLGQRARQVKPGFELTPADGPAIARLCQLVEGMPLAIDLIAAQLKVFSPADLVTALENNLDRLSATWINLPVRQRSLRVIFEHSWSYLEPVEQAVMAGLSVFRGGFNLAAIEAVAGGNWERLLRLVHKSWVRPGAAGRYELHELIRQFAAEKLASLEETEVVQARHSAYYLNFLQEQKPILFGSEPQQAGARLRPELENIRQAWAWAVVAGRYDELTPALPSLARFYEMSGFLREAISIFNQAGEALQAYQAEEKGQLPGSPAEIKLLGWLRAQEAHFCSLIGRFDQAITLAQQAVGLAQQSRSVRLEAYSFMVWGFTCLEQGKYKQARQILEPAAAMARTAKDERLEAICLLNLSGSLGMNITHLEQARQIAHRLGDFWLECQILNELGGAAVWQGLLDRARRSWELALQATLTMNNPYRTVTLQNNLGDIYRQLGDYERARLSQEQALRAARQLGNRRLEAYILEGLSRLYFMRGDYQVAWEYNQAGLALSQELGLAQNLACLYNILGHIMATHATAEAARSAYEQAIQFSQQSNPAMALESRAGLAELYMAQNDLPAAQAEVKAILAFLEQGGKLDHYTSAAVYLACYHCLHALQDPHAPQILARAYHSLQAQARIIEDESLRRSFLENIPAHRDIVNLWQATL